MPVTGDMEKAEIVIFNLRNTKRNRILEEIKSISKFSQQPSLLLVDTDKLKEHVDHEV